MSEKKREVNAFGKRNPFTSIIKGNIGTVSYTHLTLPTT